MVVVGRGRLIGCSGQAPKELKNFLKSGKEEFVFVIKGAGGTGKSKLVHAFASDAQRRGWRCVYLRRPNVNFVLGKLEELKEKKENKTIKLRGKYILWADFAGGNATELGKLAEALYCVRKKVRLILTERTANADKWENWLPDFYGEVGEGYLNKELCFGTLDLSDPETQLNEAAQRKMTSAIHSILRKNENDGSLPPEARNRKWNAIWEKAKEIERIAPDDENVPRPLVTLMVAAVFILDEKLIFNTPTTTELVRKLVNDEEFKNAVLHWRKRLKPIPGGVADVETSLMNLHAYATMVQGFECKEADRQEKTWRDHPIELISEAVRLLERDLARKAETFFRFLNQDNDSKYYIAPIEPDLIGEWLVLEWLASGGKETWVQLALQTNRDQLQAFTRRCLEDYGAQAGIEVLLRCFTENEVIGFAVNVNKCAGFVVGGIDRFGELMERERLLNLWQIFSEKFELLRVFVKAYPASEELNRILASGLSNLTAMQETLRECTETVDKIREIRDKYPNSEGVWASLSVGLANLTRRQETLRECTETVDEIREIRDRYPQNEDIGGYLAGGLANLTVKQDLEGCRETLLQIEAIRAQFPNSVRIQEYLAGAKRNLSNKGG